MARGTEGGELGSPKSAFDKKRIEPSRFLSTASTADEHGSLPWSRLSTCVPSGELDRDCQLSDPDAFPYIVSKQQIEQIICSTVASSEHSIAVSDPLDKDLALKMVSNGFEELTEFSRDEIVGRNCRVLNQFCPAEPLDVSQMRLSCMTGAPTTVLLTNRKKFGDLFHNLLFLGGLSVAQDSSSGTDLWYIIGIQKELSDSEVEEAEAHISAMQQLADDFRAEIEAQLRTLVRARGEANGPDGPDAPGGCPQWCSLVVPTWKVDGYSGAPAMQATRPADDKASPSEEKDEEEEDGEIAERGCAQQDGASGAPSGPSFGQLLATAALAATSIWLIRFVGRTGCRIAW